MSETISLTRTETFTTSADYTFDAVNVEISSGLARLKDLGGATYFNGEKTVEFASASEASSLSAFSSTQTTPANTAVGYILRISGSLYYHDGAAWVASSGALAQSNTAAQINTNAATAPLVAGSYLNVVIVLSSNGTATPSVDTLAFTFGFHGQSLAAPGECAVYCFLKDILGVDVASTAEAVLIAINEQSFTVGSFLIPRFYKEEVFVNDASGAYCQMSLAKTSSVGKKIRFQVAYKPLGDQKKQETIRLNPVVIPDQLSANLMAITSIDDSQLV